jgi:SAM-dependent methyltransferase
MLLDHHAGKPGVHEIVERDDGLVETVTMDYFGAVGRWPAVERRALRHVRGRVLDVGCGAGRVALELQARGHDVVAIDVSRGAVGVAAQRGVRDARLLRFEEIDRSLGRFGTVVMFGNNFGLFGGEAKARRMLRRLATLADRIVATSNNPYATDDPVHLAYHERNRGRARMPGQLRIRVRYRQLASPWFDYLLVSEEELRTLVAGTGWRVTRLLEGEGSYYALVLERE